MILGEFAFWIWLHLLFIKGKTAPVNNFYSPLRQIAKTLSVFLLYFTTFNWSKMTNWVMKLNVLHVLLTYYSLWVGDPGCYHGYRIGRNLTVAFGKPSTAECLGLGLWVLSESVHEPGVGVPQSGSERLGSGLVFSCWVGAWRCWEGAPRAGAAGGGHSLEYPLIFLFREAKRMRVYLGLRKHTNL